MVLYIKKQKEEFDYSKKSSGFKSSLMFRLFGMFRIVLAKWCVQLL